MVAVEDAKTCGCGCKTVSADGVCVDCQRDREIAKQRLFAIRSCAWILYARLQDGSGADAALEQINAFGDSHALRAGS